MVAKAASEERLGTLGLKNQHAVTLPAQQAMPAIRFVRIIGEMWSYCLSKLKHY